MSKETTGNPNSRRSFLVKLGLGVAALAGVSTGLVKLGKKQSPAMSRDFPGPDSIFHPARDPRQDPRRG
ncbi:MAG: twin-arginine translocation signal domain-containing protein [Dehalococcoidia bacterium]